MKNSFFLAAAFMLLLTTACQQGGSNQAAEHNDHEGEAVATAYACPMKCEGDKTYDQPGECPVCGMNLKAVGVASPYEMGLSVTPAAPEAGKPATLAFTPRMKGNDAAQVPLDEVHTKKIHVIVASKDLSWYDHIHPDFQADGSYTVQETFPAGGEYIIFADYTPTGAGNEVQRLTVNVSGTPKAPESFSAESLSTQTAGYTVTLKPVAGKLLTNNVNHLGVEVMEKGKRVTNFEDVMGAKGHLVIISMDGQKYIHVHPEEVDGELDMHAQFEAPGLYRAFYQFQTNGVLHTSHLTLNVKEGKPGELGTQEGHEAGEHGHEH